jgi:hypothetical protein
VVDNALVEADFSLGELPVDAETGARLLETFSGFSLELPISLGLSGGGSVRQLEEDDVECRPASDIYDPLLDSGYEYYRLTSEGFSDTAFASPVIIRWPLAGFSSQQTERLQFLWAPALCADSCTGCTWNLQPGIEVDLEAEAAVVKTDHFSIWSLVQVRANGTVPGRWEKVVMSSCGLYDN